MWWTFIQNIQINCKLFDNTTTCIKSYSHPLQETNCISFLKIIFGCIKNKLICILSFFRQGEIFRFHDDISVEFMVLSFSVLTFSLLISHIKYHVKLDIIATRTKELSFFKTFLRTRKNIFAVLFLDVFFNGLTRNPTQISTFDEHSMQCHKMFKLSHCITNKYVNPVAFHSNGFSFPKFDFFLVSSVKTWKCLSN